MKTRLRIFTTILLAALALLWGPALRAQTVFSATTLAAALSDTSSQTMTVSSTTGFTASSTGLQYYALVDREVVAVRTVNTTTKVIGIQRGALSTRATPHLSGAAVTVGPGGGSPQGGGFQSFVPSGPCVRTNLSAVPWIVSGATGLGSDVGSTWDCLGVTTTAQWVQTNGFEMPVKGTTVASATSITPTGTFFVVSGNTQITTIVVPAGWAPGLSIYLNPSGTWSTATGGNISIGTTAVVNKVLCLTWDGTNWNPSYLSVP